MKPTTILAVLCLFFPLAKGLHAATHVVMPGQSLQAAVDKAREGDVVVVAEGTHHGNVKILGKNIGFRREAGARVILTGGITLERISRPFVLAHFTLSGRLVVYGCVDVFLHDLDGSKGATLSVGPIRYTCKAYAYKCKFKSVTVSGTSHQNNRVSCPLHECSVEKDVQYIYADVEVIRTTIGGNLTSSYSIKRVPAASCTVFQSTIKGELKSSMPRNWLGYSNLRNVVMGGAEAEIVGNVFDSSSAKDVSALNIGAQVAKVRNNVFAGTSRPSSSREPANDCHGISIGNSTTALIHNNVFTLIGGHGVSVSSVSGDVEIVGNYFDKKHWGGNGSKIRGSVVSAPFGHVTCSYNFVDDDSSNGGHADHYFHGGVEAKNNLRGKPNFAKSSASEVREHYRLSKQSYSRSPLLDAGSPLAKYKDPDGSRQDIGLWGGHSFDPSGVTSRKPVVLSAGLSKTRIYKGEPAKLRLNSRAAVSTHAP